MRTAPPLVIATVWIALGGAVARAAEPDPGKAVDRSTYVALHFPGADGERFDVIPFRRHLFLTISRRHDSIQYFARGFASAKRIQGSFGRFGSVDVRFEPQGHPHFDPAPKPCTGGTDVQRGVFTGSIEYVGDSGYAPVSRTQAPGLVAVSHVGCRPTEVPLDPDSYPPSPAAIALTAWDGDAFGAGTLFEALQLDGKRHANFFATTSSRERGVSISRTVYRAAPSDRFTFNLREHRARVEPPPPFAGEASLTRTGGENVWAGTLSATFPGLGAVPLAGPEFTARLQRATVLIIARKASRALLRVARQVARYAGKYAPASRPPLSSP